MKKDAPVLLLEVKAGDDTLSAPLKYYSKHCPGVDAVQLGLRLRQPQNVQGIRVARRWTGWRTYPPETQ